MTHKVYACEEREIEREREREMVLEREMGRGKREGVYGREREKDTS